MIYVNRITQLIQQSNRNKSNAYFVDGQCGSGKTFVNSAAHIQVIQFKTESYVRGID